MYRSRVAWLAYAAGLASTTNGQQSGWVEGQANTTMCIWYNHRIATLKDTVYIDGGHLYWSRGMADGSFLPPEDDQNPLGLIYTFNFSTPFNSSSNFTALLGNTISKGLNGGPASNVGPNFLDGAMLHNNDEFFLYGGLLAQTDTASPPGGEDVLNYEASQSRGETGTFRPGFIIDELPEGMTRYVAYGGAVSAPSENKGWYFGGYRSESWGPIYEYTGNSSLDPSNVSDTLITLDMRGNRQATWSNDTLPPGIPGRANPSVVWVPVGAEGILVALGGVSYPGYGVGSGEGRSLNAAQSRRDSPGFMANVDIYDIAADRWYQQPTIAGPTQLAMGCAVVAPASDYSSFNIYYYGGYDGLDTDSDFNDDVWILSLPSFMWMKVSSGSPQHARAGHHCVMPYPDQMITIGGRRSTQGNSLPCVGDGKLFDVFNLTSGNWMESYDPTSWNDYGVPEMIHLMIGGDYAGGATMTTPTPTGWATSGLASVFATAYPTTKLATYYPYSSVGPGNSTREDYEANQGGGGTPSWVAPVLGVVLGLVFVTAVVVAVLLYRRRRLLKKSAGSDQSTDENGNRVRTWMETQQGYKAPTVTTEDTRTQYEEMESRGVTPMLPPGHPEMRMMEPVEMPDGPISEHQISEFQVANRQIAELQSDSRRVELPVPDNTYGRGNPTKYAYLGSNPHQLSTPASQPHFGSHDHPAIAVPPAASFSSQERPDSPSLGADTRFDAIANVLPKPAPSPISIPPAAAAAAAAAASPEGADSHNAAAAAAPSSGPRKAVVSGLSGISSRDSAHLRQISDVTVSSDAGSAAPPAYNEGAGNQQQPRGNAPAEPPTANQAGSDWDRGDRAGAGSPLRRSIFHEDTGDLGGRGPTS
ncbi:hypothetical protein GGS23DRAFT_117206 [Durotheca rogersii]|uniref:uncharacterized protein n=1 Tax=Durotheca rogersii TaxID=419775 RepID=UPI00221EC34D|nr:uncharacterized protein GGS23DRAFT_117206 [Durotheca rogersii]KAI5861883.1 hypothetical protein GGS23DRAFT_117206 [Durotheca rogersii]